MSKGGFAATLNIEGDEQLIHKMGSSLYVGPVSRFFRAAGEVVRGRAIDNAPRFDGHLANSLETTVDRSSPPRFVTVGTNADYAEAVEKGSRPHFPPVAAVAPWAKAHGIAPYALALSIARKGTKAHPFLKPALEDSRTDITMLLARMGTEIEAMGGGA